MGFDCVICSKLLEEDADPPPPTSSTTQSVETQSSSPPKRARPGPASFKLRSKNNNNNNGLKQPTQPSSKNQNQICIVTPCGHLFHKICATSWVAKAGNCPNCRVTCSFDELTTIYPDIDNDKEIQLQESLQRKLKGEWKEKTIKLEFEINSLKDNEVVLKECLSELQRQIATSETSNNLINETCIQQKALIENLRKELEESTQKLAEVQRQVTTTTAALDINGKYELICSRNFKDYLKALDIPTYKYLGNNSANTPPTRSAPSYNEIHWQRETATINITKQKEGGMAESFSINTIYYYRGRIHTSCLDFVLGKEFESSVEGCDEQYKKLGKAKTLITMESPNVLKQVQTFINKHHKSRTITIIREFSASGMKVILENADTTKSCVRLYEKIVPGTGTKKSSRILSKQSVCREIFSEDEESDDESYSEADNNNDDASANDSSD